MSESINIEYKKQKPPLSVVRIVGEILISLALGIVSMLLVFFTGFWITGSNELGDFLFLILFVAGSPLLFGIGCVAGVYLVGSIGKQTGSFSVSLIGGFAVGFVVLIPSLSLFNIGKVTDNSVPLLLFWLIPSIAATLCFNLTRRYKEPPST